MQVFSRAIRLVFFGNYFYGLCAVALSFEASLQLGYPLNGWIFYLMIFCVTVLYYSKAYLTTETSPVASNLRSAWYARNRKMTIQTQWVLLLVFIAAGAGVLPRIWEGIIGMSPLEWLLVVVFPVVSALYYGVIHEGKAYNIRNIGWLKPFVIGFTWAGLVNVYPILYHHLVHGGHVEADLSAVFLFIKNFMFISVLCIMFDIKDYEMDYNLQLKTFVVGLGPRRTIWMVIVPLCVLGLVSFLLYASIREFPAGRILINLIPFVLITLVAASLRHERSIFYYLVIIDGLMLVKALCGIVGVVYF